MKKKKFTKSRYIGFVILISVVLFLANVTVGIIILISSRNAVKEIIYRNMSEVSDTAATLINGDEFATITIDDSTNKTDKYTKVYDTLKIFADKNSIAYIYAVRDSGETTDGHEKYVFVVDPDAENPGEYGKEIVYTEALYNASRGTTSIDNEATEDEWGSFYTAFSPILDSNGKVVGVVGVDFHSEWYENQISKFTVYFLVISTMSLVVGSLIAFLASSRVLRRFRVLNKELIVLSKDVDTLAEEVSIKPIHSETIAEKNFNSREIENDEIEQLSDKIKLMQNEIRKYLDYIHSQAYVDSMTGVGNKTAYLDYVKTLDEKISKRIANFSIIVFDINGLKTINDSKGHEEGDETIINTTTIIKDVFGADHTYRIGGDEFIVIIEDITTEEIETAFMRIRSESEKFNNNRDANTTKVSFSMGAATYSKELDTDYKSVFRRADDAMYRNKGLYYKDSSNRHNN